MKGFEVCFHRVPGFAYYLTGISIRERMLLCLCGGGVYVDEVRGYTARQRYVGLCP